VKRYLVSVAALVCITVSSGTQAADENGNVIINRKEGGTTVSVKSEVNTGIDLGKGNENLIRGNGKMASDTREIGEFGDLEVSGAFDIVCLKGENDSVKITCDSNILPHIVTKVAGTALSISADAPLSLKNPVKIEIVSKSGDIAGAKMSSSCKLKAVDVARDAAFSIALEGASSAELSGKTDDFKATLKGACSLNAKELKTKTAAITVSGAGKAEVSASEKLSANITGLGSIDYYGDPKDVVKNISGLGSLNKK